MDRIAGGGKFHTQYGLKYSPLDISVQLSIFTHFLFIL
jgi:hypothetical protein